MFFNVTIALNFENAKRSVRYGLLEKILVSLRRLSFFKEVTMVAESILERTLPQSIEAEMSVLGAMILDNEVISLDTDIE